MSDQTKPRYAVDLDDLERQLRQTASTQPKARSADPLADLARIVGQDDPFRSLFADRRPGAAGGSAAGSVVSAPPSGRIEPTLSPMERLVAAADSGSAPKSLAPVAAAPQQDILDEFDRLLQNELRGTSRPDDAMLADADDRTVLHLDRRLDRDPVVHDVVNGSEMRDPLEADRFEAEPLRLDTVSERIFAEENLPRDEQQPLQQGDYPEPPDEQPADLRSLEPQQPRKGLVIAGVMLGIAALGVGAVVGLRGLSGSVRSGGEPPVIKAEAGPSKVQPQNPGGVEIPNQNKQIYERTPEPKPGEARIVNREEQPIDVQATARAASRVILPGPGAPGAATAAPSPVAVAPASPVSVTPPVSGPAAAPPAAQVSASQPAATQPPTAATAALGEPRRVRTIAVRPDGTIAPPNGAATATPAAPAAPLTAAPSPPARPSTPAVTASTPASIPASTPVPRPPAARPATAEEGAARSASARTQVAAAPATAPVPSAPATPRAADTPAAGGGFMVQLGAPGSEAEARSTFASLQRRFADQLSGDSPVIRRADVGNGRTVYRLRVGPFSREDAAEKCQALQAAGGQCFIARN